MIPNDLGDVPTLACLNKPQKRALILRDQLRYLEPAHLDTFLSGITADEPPTYRNVNGAVYPPLAPVTIKEEATRFDLGNVQFPEEGGVMYRAFLTVEDERFEMRTEDALPRDDAELGSIAIHRFVAENMFPLFKTKYKAIHARMEKINEARRVAYNMLDHPPAKFKDGETLTRLTGKSKPADDSLRDGDSRKRKEITKHVSNKRQRVGLETIPDNIKSETFNTIPTQIKVDLFNNIIKTAFPNFDNLITASWNMVSVYSNVGSDFPELHKAVVELKGALEEFESAHAPPRSKAGRSRKEATPNQQSGGSSRAATPTKEPRLTPIPDAHPNLAPVEQAREGSGGMKQHDRDEENDSQQLMPPPHILQSNQQSQEQVVKEDERLSAPQGALKNADARAHSVPRYTPESLLPTPKPTPTSSPASPSMHKVHQTLERAHKTSDRSTGPRSSPSSYEHLQAPGSELMRKRQEYTASLSRAKRSSTGAVPGAHAEEDGEEEQYDNDYAHTYEQRRPGSEGTHTVFLGNSVLGAKKPMGSAPVAPMLHTRKDGGRSTEGRRG